MPLFRFAVTVTCLFLGLYAVLMQDIMGALIAGLLLGIIPWACAEPTVKE